MKARMGYCTRCKMVTEFDKKKIIARAGDNNTMSSYDAWQCKECLYTPLFEPKWLEKDEKDGK